MTILKCPLCKNGDLLLNIDKYSCNSCKKSFDIENGIPKMFVNDYNYTSNVRDFYEKTPFPKYNDIDNIVELQKKANKTIFASNLNEQLDTGIKVLEAGCGTGQMSIFLSLKNREVYATDMSISSLELGKEFADKFSVNNVHFYQMNIFNPIFKNNSFDVLISNGVLHHTHDPYKAFQSLLPLVKSEGLIIIGLYHKYSRIWTDIRRNLFKISEKLVFLDEVLRDEFISQEKKDSWFNDQYKNDYESKHTILEVMEWFNKNNCQVLNVLPNLISKKDNNSLFYPRKYNSKTEIILNEYLMTFNNIKEGGFFTIIGKKNS